MSKGAAFAGSSPPPFQLKRLDHIVIRCHDFDNMYRFYTKVLGCTVDQPEDVGRFGGALTHLRAGDAYIDLLSYNVKSDESREMLRKMHAGGKGADDLKQVSFSSNTSTLDHLCLRVDPFDEQAMRSFLEKENGVQVLSSGQRKGAEGTGPSLYIEDPEGNVVELKGHSSS